MSLSSSPEQQENLEPQIIRAVIPYRPRPLQRQLHNEPARFMVLVCHRRFGKTVWAINQLIRKVMKCQLEDPRGMYCAPFLKQARSIAWDYLVKFSLPIPGVKINRGQLSVDYPNGGRITLAGADNVDAHRGIYLDALVLDEYAQMSPRIWSEVFRPALSDRIGCAAFIGTPKGRGNSFADVYHRADTLEGWKGILLTVKDTGLIAQAELDSARQEMTEDEYNQEFMCSFDAAIKGAYYGKLMAEANEGGRICHVPYEPSLPVYTACDLGISDAFAVWFFQFVGREVHFIDYKEYAGAGLPEVFRELQRLPYTYGDHIAPHDIRVRELGTGVSRIETARTLGVSYKIARNLPVMDGIDAVRLFLPRCYFDKEKCWCGIEALRSYRSEWDDVKRIESIKPLHDWASHGADALRYVAVTYGKGSQPDLLSAPLDYSLMNRRAV